MGHLKEHGPDRDVKGVNVWRKVELLYGDGQVLSPQTVHVPLASLLT